MILLAETTFLEKLSDVATIIAALSFFLAIIIFLIESKRRAREKQLATYNNLSKEYREFLKFCFNNNELRVITYDSFGTLESELSDTDKIKKYMLFDILISLLESAYFEYGFHKNEFKRIQWTGWYQYMRDWCLRKDFQIAWKEDLGSQYDSEFLSFMNNLIDECINEQKLKRQN